MLNSTATIGLSPDATSLIRLTILSMILIVTLTGASLIFAVREYGKAFGPMAHVEAQIHSALWVQRQNQQILNGLQNKSKGELKR